MLTGGLQTDLGFHRWLVDHPGFVAGNYDTGFVAAEWDEGPALSSEEVALVGLAAREARASQEASTGPMVGTAVASNAGRSGDSAWARLGRREGLR